MALDSPERFELPLTTTPARASGGVTFGIRPQDLQITPGWSLASGVHEVENHGTEQVVTLR
jgi:multiple sugar transport system ATP-binding protein